METSKKKPQLIESFFEDGDSPDPSSTDESNVDPQISVTERYDIYEVSRRVTEEKDLEDRKPVSKNQLINKLNFINFQDSTLLITLKHRNYDAPLTLLARPQPCLGDELECSWVKSEKDLQALNFYEFQNILIPDGQNLIRMKPDLIRMDKKVIHLRLPDNGYEVSSRTVRRHASKGITAQLIQNSTIFSGTLVDFNACSLKIELKAAPPQTFEWINSEASVNLILSDQE